MPQSHIRNFSIIAHIDHGKTTLTDRLLHATGTVSERVLEERMMDSNPIEKERGITIKLAPVRMNYQAKDGQQYQLNLIDTPGHVDFGYEVSRSLAACEGALLVVDATQGIQAQTLSNYEKARQLGLTIIPVLNKIDLPSSDVETVILDLMELFHIQEEEVILVSAKTGLNIDTLLEAIVQKIPAPQGDSDQPLRALIFTSKYDQHKGVIAYSRVIDGELTKEMLQFMVTKTSALPVEIGIFSPQMQPIPSLKTGEVGYVATGLKDVTSVRVGDTITSANHPAFDSLPGYNEPKPMVYMDFYPIDGDDYVLLQDAMGKLILDDSALKYTSTHSVALGNGLRVGFLGILHNEIVKERLEREFNLELITTSPSVTYQVELTNGTRHEIHNSADFPDPSLIKTIFEPMTKMTIFTPKEYYGNILVLTEEFRGTLLEVQNIGARVQMVYTLPLAELIINFHDQLKSASQGFASMEYEVSTFDPVDAVKLDIMIQGEHIEALSQVVVRDKAEFIGRKLVKKLKEVVPRQNFEVPIQAAIGGKIVARETIKAYRKDVTAKLYGGDITRRKKLLEKQKKGKKRMKEIGKVMLNQEAFLAVLER
ncbi:MAG: translation elongation factor 4 [Patescibacteria group bacterium]